MPGYYSRPPRELGGDAACSGVECTLATAIDGLFPLVFLAAVALLAVALTVVPRARERCEEERRRTRAEARAFDRFARRVADVEASPPAPGAGADAAPTAALASPPPDAGLRAVRESYRDTVMAVPHYDSEYGESLADNVAAEFDPGAAAALTDGRRLTPRVKRALVRSAVDARDRRRRLVATVEAEADSLDPIEASFRDAETTLETLNGRPLPEYSFEGLVEAWERLDRLETDLERTLADREAEVRTGENVARGISDPWSTYDYLYGPLSTGFPALHEGARLLADARTAGRRTLRALASRA